MLTSWMRPKASQLERDTEDQRGPCARTTYTNHRSGVECGRCGATCRRWCARDSCTVWRCLVWSHFWRPGPWGEGLEPSCQPSLESGARQSCFLLPCDALNLESNETVSMLTK